MAGNEKKFIPALEWDWATPLYDTLVRVTMPEEKCKAWLVEDAAARVPASAVLADIGCGTGTLLYLLARRFQSARVTGLDADPNVLKLARRKLRRNNATGWLVNGFADALPFQSAGTDALFSTLIFHHLDRQTKVAALQEFARVLKPGGIFYLADFGPPHTATMRVVTQAWRKYHSGDRLEDNVNGFLPALMEGAGFIEVEVPLELSTPFGTWTVYRARNCG